jgi:hypothetical protein
MLRMASFEDEEPMRCVPFVVRAFQGRQVSDYGRAGAPSQDLTVVELI